MSSQANETRKTVFNEAERSRNEVHEACEAQKKAKSKQKKKKSARQMKLFS
jgi:hypothetical protein